MNVICVDDEQLALDLILSQVNRINYIKTIQGFLNPETALLYAKDNKVDVAFIDINMPQMSGLELTAKLKAINSNINIIIVTAYDSFALDAFKLDCSGYILKPVSYKDIDHQLSVLRFSTENNIPKLKAHCFGNFEITYDGLPIKFKYSKAKELLALLIDKNGSLCSNNQIQSTLWSDNKDHSEYLKSIKRDLSETLESLGIGDAIDTTRGQMAVIKDKLDCDLFDLLANNYNGPKIREYMAQYPWAQDKLQYFKDNF